MIDPATGRIRPEPVPDLISVLCPTRNRPDSVAELITTAAETIDGPIEVIFYLDDDDKSADRVRALTEQVTRFPVRTITGPRIVLSQCWNECAAIARGEIMMQCGDDIRFRTAWWDTQVREIFARIPDRIVLVHGRDGHQDHKLATHGFLHRRWVDTVGYFVPPIFASDYNDQWLTEVADAIGRRVYLPGVYTEHMHPAAGKGEWDRTHQERLVRHRRDNVDALYAGTANLRHRDAERLRAVLTPVVSA
jgi:glycosyltransferase involved in cell wall biosynthesis